MRKETYLTKNLMKHGTAAQYDAEAKRILGDKSVLARILAETVKELEGYGLKEIEGFLEGPSEEAMPVITGTNTENVIPKNLDLSEDGMALVWRKTWNDGRTYLVIPGEVPIKILLNFEAQKNYHPGCDLMPRGIYYCCVMIAGQEDKEFEGENYDGLKKVYGIWLNFNAPRKEADSMYCVELQPDTLMGNPPVEDHRYDLINVTMIGLNNDSYKTHASTLHGYLGTIFTNKLSPEEKVRILENEYGVKPTKEMKGGLNNMCGLGEAIEYNALERGRREERENTKREKARADAAETKLKEEKTRADEEKTRADLLAKEVERLNRILASVGT